jgi:TRAP-type C4-dicarboxylate transport system permease small subunit
MVKLFSKCESTLTFVAASSTLIILCLTTADTFGRLVFNAPIPGAYEITEQYLMVAAVYLAVTFAYRKDVFSKVRVTIFVDHLPQQTQVVLNYLAQVFSILFIGVLIFSTTRKAIQIVATGTTQTSLAYPLWPGYVIIPVGLFFMFILMVRDLKRIRDGKSDPV